ncbi:MAG: hypothetical protein ACODAG_09430 [Myxococcota bacterium]
MMWQGAVAALVVALAAAVVFIFVFGWRRRQGGPEGGPAGLGMLILTLMVVALTVVIGAYAM